MHLHAPLPSLILQPLRARHRWRGIRVRRRLHGYRCGDGSAGGGLGRSPQCGHVLLHGLKNRGAAVLQQMPPVRDVDGIRRTAPAAIGVARATVAGDHLDAGVGAQPRCKAIRLAVGQQVNDGTAFQVDEDRAVALATLPGPVSTPSTRGAVSGIVGAPRQTRRSRVAPPSARPMWCWRLPKRTVRWACGLVTAGKRSAKMRCIQPGRPQRSRRTCISICTRRPCQGRSASRRG